MSRRMMGNTCDRVAEGREGESLNKISYMTLPQPNVNCPNNRYSQKCDDLECLKLLQYLARYVRLLQQVQP